MKREKELIKERLEREGNGRKARMVSLRFRLFLFEEV
jgi:hypothetical protein